MKFSIITGMSGAGKSTVLKNLEDLGFFCVDNLPPALISKFADICFSPDSGINNVALGIDVRGGEFFKELFEEIDKLKAAKYNISLIFLEASDEALIKRFKETRRRHPLVNQGRIEDGIRLERELLQEAKRRADYIIDTSSLLTRELKSEIYKIFVEEKDYDNLIVTVLSFGFKYGIPSDCDLVFDVRFIPNPFYLAELRAKTGNDSEVQEYVMKWEMSKDFLLKLDDMISFLLPHYVQEGKNQLVVGIGCTGGKHRSVTLAIELHKKLLERDYSAKIHHRDIEKDAQRGH
ncbi:MAG: RNase adapter RapZ [Vallitaleaceae bacterium]|nr:RNase adapter RapZ [Vallitaleaceae bacterium]